jgi:hypothetical protein
VENFGGVGAKALTVAKRARRFSAELNELANALEEVARRGAVTRSDNCYGG